MAHRLYRTGRVVAHPIRKLHSYQLYSPSNESWCAVDHGIYLSPSATSYAILLLIISLGVGTGLLFSSIPIYLGLSGSLHGLFAFYALSEALQGRKSSWLLLAGVVIKVIWEMTQGASVATAELIDARVAVEAHLTGVLIAIPIAGLNYIYRKNGR